jgi:hypothetical protein
MKSEQPDFNDREEIPPREVGPSPESERQSKIINIFGCFMMGLLVFYGFIAVLLTMRVK